RAASNSRAPGRNLDCPEGTKPYHASMNATSLPHAPSEWSGCAGPNEWGARTRSVTGTTPRPEGGQFAYGISTVFDSTSESHGSYRQGSFQPLDSRPKCIQERRNLPTLLVALEDDAQRTGQLIGDVDQRLAIVAPR